MHDGVHLLVMGGVSSDNIKMFFIVISHQMSLLSEDHVITQLEAYASISNVYCKFDKVSISKGER